MKPKLLIAADTYIPKKDGVVRFLKETVTRLSHDFNITLIVPNFEKRKIEIKEIPISYRGRTAKEGKKIKAKDFIFAVLTLLWQRIIK